MSKFEYKVVPAPKMGLKAKGIKTSEDRFANALQTVMNELGAQGWEYQRADTLPCQEQPVFKKRVTISQNMLVFRRAIEEVSQEVSAPQKHPVQEGAAPQESPVQRKVRTVTRILDSSPVAPKPLADDPARPDPKLAAE